MEKPHFLIKPMGTLALGFVPAGQQHIVAPLQSPPLYKFHKRSPNSLPLPLFLCKQCTEVRGNSVILIT